MDKDLSTLVLVNQVFPQLAGMFGYFCLALKGRIIRFQDKFVSHDSRAHKHRPGLFVVVREEFVRTGFKSIEPPGKDRLPFIENFQC